MDQTQLVYPLQIHNLVNLIRAYLMGQPYDRVHDVWGNLLLVRTLQHLSPFDCFHNIHKDKLSLRATGLHEVGKGGSVVGKRSKLMKRREKILDNICG